jgi:hypothetical protein
MRSRTLILAVMVAVLVLVSSKAPAQSPPKIIPRFAAIPGPMDVAAYRALGEAGKAIPTWGAFFQYNNQFYGFDMIGTDPGLGSATTKIKFVIIPVALKFADGTVLDPTQPVQCNGTDSALTRVLGSPVLHKVKWTLGGTFVGKTQFADAFQRAEWWNFANGSAPDYHVVLHPIVKARALINVPRQQGTVQTGKGCGVYGDVSGLYLDAKLRSILVKRRLQPNELPFFLTYDVVADHGILGYHSTQYTTLFATATYNDQRFGEGHAFQDLVPMSQVLAATINDPFLHNLTPNWRSSFMPHGCNNLLEVGQPLAGLAVPAKVPGNAHRYYVQDLAFELWFAKAPASTSVNGWFSMFGTFTDSASNQNCH